MGKEDQFQHFSPEQSREYLERCKNDISENLPTSEGGLYIGSVSNSKDKEVLVIGYGDSRIIRKGFQAILSHPVLKGMLMEELTDYLNKNSDQSAN